MRVMRWGLLCLLWFAACDGGGAGVVPVCGGAVPLTAAEVETILVQAAGRALADGQAFHLTVVSREGIVLGSLRMAGAPAGLEGSTRAKARTAAFLSSNQHAFNTRTARFIIQDNFPPDVPNAPGGPLYGVQFSSMACSDVVGENLTGGAKLFAQVGNGLSADTGSIPLYREGCLVGALGVDGFPETDPDDDDAFEERAAWAGALGFRPAPSIYGSQIHIDGIRVEFLKEMPPDDAPLPLYADLVAAGDEIVAPTAAPPAQAFPMGMFGGLTCEIRYPIVDSARPVPATERLLAADVAAMLDAGAARSAITRAGIRRPLGTPMRCFISVVDTDGTILGSIRTPDATLFSFGVSIQKARTVAFFSTDAVGFTCRALGFMSQGHFPPGIEIAPRGPLANDYFLAIGPPGGPGDVLALQDALSVPLLAPIEDPGMPGTFVCQAPTVAELPNGTTIFPGGVPVYKSGVLVGGVGVSGDGVDQDDFISSAAGEVFPPPPGVRCDEVSEALAVSVLRARLDEIRARAQAVVDDPMSFPEAVAQAGAIVDAAVAADANYAALGLQGIRLPYVKFPRQPYID